MIFFLTATGNSLYVAKRLGEGLGQELASIPQQMKAGARVFRDDVIGIGCPIFGHELPVLVRDFVRGSAFETDYFFVTRTSRFRKSSRRMIGTRGSVSGQRKLPGYAARTRRQGSPAVPSEKR